MKSLPRSDALLLARSCCSAGMSTVRFGAPLANGHALLQRCVGVDHARARSPDRWPPSPPRSASSVPRARAAAPGRSRSSAHHTITRRSQPCSRMNLRMSSRSASASSSLFALALDVRAVEALHVVRREHRRHRLHRRQRLLQLLEQRRLEDAARGGRTRRRCPGRRPRRRTRTSSSSASGTNSLMSGVRRSVRLPSRMVPICVSEPMGFASPRRTASTPAMRVVPTAPSPGMRTASLPDAGAMERGLFTERSSGVRVVLEKSSGDGSPGKPSRSVADE